ncbi:PEP-CTERM sorting domain-containing protein [Aeoliella sp. ICT_H6.2]|uniref:PEP-CTERM sorting domain-containing protein n=1 Tax=Aeoliella straminimaris TaxID=2954799 RepID=A0A9X2JEH7_9BACT|nr:choice-of-anchor R domain-containing protein [Aeoliella straminimaris]MCO6042656.1 PEP-CTERM sorting domain-containing protein [Aeoliella straminimaris]
MKTQLIVTAIVLSFAAAPSQADVIFSNLGAGDTFSAAGRIFQGESVGTIGNVDQAASFSVGGTSYLLDSLELGVNVTSAGPLDVILAADNGGEPGAELEAISLNLAVGEQLALASAAGTTMLDANTTYWVIADAKGSIDGGWRFNTTGDVGLTAGRSAGVGSTNYGDWNLRPDDDRYAFRVQGTPMEIPEPTSVALFVIAGIGATALRLRKRD